MVCAPAGFGEDSFRSTSKLNGSPRKRGSFHILAPSIAGQWGPRGPARASPRVWTLDGSPCRFNDLGDGCPYGTIIALVVAQYLLSQGFPSR
jgi:hypothetical protein